MKILKSPVIAALAVLGLLLTSCGTDGPSEPKDTYNAFYAYDPSTFNYASSNKGEDAAHFANFVDGLYEGDRLGLTYRPALADGEPVASRWGDETVGGLQFVVNVKRNIPWVNSAGEIQEQYGFLKPSDFVKTAELALDSRLSTEAESSAYMYMTFIRGASDFFKATQAAGGALADINNVGVKADDDAYTLTYDLIEELSVESFKSALSYSCFLPINEDFYNNLATKKINFGNISNSDSILYNGAYTLSKIVKGKSYTYTRNPHYWDVDNVPTKTIYLIRYPDGGGSTVSREYFEKKIVDGFSPNTSDSRGWQKYVTGKDGKGTFYEPAHEETQVVENITSSTIWYNSYNFNRIEDNLSNSKAVLTQTNNFLKNASVGNNVYRDATNTLAGTSDTQIANQILNTKKALANRNFRLGLLHSFPRSIQLNEYTPHNPNQWMRNNMTMPDFLDVEPGVDYIEKVAEHYATVQSTNPDNRPENLEVNFTKEQAFDFINDGNDALYNIDLAAFYFEKAKTELTSSGVVFPVMLMDVFPYSIDGVAIYEEFAKFYNGLKSGEQVGKDLPIPAADYGVLSSYLDYKFVGLESTNYITAMDAGFFDMMTVGWTPDYADPLTYVRTHCTGGMMAEDMNKLKPTDPLAATIYGNVDRELEEASRLGNEGDSVGRLNQIALAEYYMVHHDAIILPLYASGIGQGISVSRVVPYLLQRNPVGLASDKFKGLVVMTKPITNAERKDLYQKFLADKALALTNS